MLVEMLVDKPKDEDYYQCKQDEVKRCDRIRNEGVKRFIVEIFCIIKRVTLLPPCGKAGKERKCGRMEEKNGFVCISWPSYA